MGSTLIRIDKLFSELGILSRSECKLAAQRGKIRVNDTVIRSSDLKVNRAKDEIYFEGKWLDTREFVYYMFNKPSGVITASEDRHQQTVMDFIKDKRSGLAPVGRLDKDTTGLLLITNDGDLNHRVLSPKNHVEKGYLALIDGTLNEEDKDRLTNGIDIGDDKPTLPAKLSVLDEDNPQMVLLTITEGRYHQVKRMFDAVGKPVIKLQRQSFGPLSLDENLPFGEYRELSETELAELLKSAGKQ